MKFDESSKPSNEQGQKTTSISGGSKKLVQVLVEKESEKIPVSDLRVSDRKILHILGETSELNHYYTFKGLMRKINLHQQSLARALHRLESLELIEKTKTGYQLKQKYKSLSVKSYQDGFSTIKVPMECIGFTQLIQTYIPTNIATSQTISTLVGKWFGNLRWLALVEGNNEFILQWVSVDSKFQLNLRLLTRCMIMETNASSQKERIEALISSYKILESTTKIFKQKLNDNETNAIACGYGVFDQNS